jgi:hypothetical protein
MQSIPKPQSGDTGDRWLDYARQLYRTDRFMDAVGAFDRAIAKDRKLLGNYGKALSLASTNRDELALKAIDLAISAIPSALHSAR